MYTEKLNLFSLGGDFYLHLCAFLCFTNYNKLAVF